MNTFELRNISKVFFNNNVEVEVVKNTNITIPDRTFSAIVGPSGSGKSTLLTMLGALQKPTTGELRFGETILSTKNSRDLSNYRFTEIGFILQASNLIPYLTLFEQYKLRYKYANRRVDKKRISEVFESLSIDKIQHKYPEEISGGERQRAAIGLALLLKPRVILADEPTASLDTEKAYDVIEIFKKITTESETSVIMVTHDTRMLEYCDQVFEMRDGNLRLIEI